MKGTCTKLPCDYWHPPEYQFYKSESGCKFGGKCSSAHRQVEGQPSKKPRKDGDESAVRLDEGDKCGGQPREQLKRCKEKVVEEKGRLGMEGKRKERGRKDGQRDRPESAVKGL